MKMTTKLWESTFDHPHERAGVTFGRTRNPAILLPDSNENFNRKFKCLEPRFLTEVCIFVRAKDQHEEEVLKRSWLRLKAIRQHRMFRQDKSLSGVFKPSSAEENASWRREYHLLCELGTKGVILEVRQSSKGCLIPKKDELKESMVFAWSDMMGAPSLMVGREVVIKEKWRRAKLGIVASMTPPVQAPYFLRCVQDRVTSDNGAMISDVILEQNKFKPQEGRWLTRTVLNHAGKECFVIRIRVGRGIYRRGGETPSPVKSEEKIIQICDGTWSYIADSIGTAPEKVVGTAIPRIEEGDRTIVHWSLSTGHELTIQWDHGLNLQLKSKNSSQSVYKLLNGRQMSYQVTIPRFASEDEEGFLTLVSYSDEHNPTGKATGLLNWKLFAMEFLAEEDAVLFLLICTAIVRSISGIKNEDVANMSVRRRLKQVQAGSRDWGSIIDLQYDHSNEDQFVRCKQQLVHVHPWYWNAEEVLALPDQNDVNVGQSKLSQRSAADGGDHLYKGM